MHLKHFKDDLTFANIQNPKWHPNFAAFHIWDLDKNENVQF